MADVVGQGQGMGADGQHPQLEGEEEEYTSESSSSSEEDTDEELTEEGDPKSGGIRVKLKNSGRPTPAEEQDDQGEIREHQRSSPESDGGEDAPGGALYTPWPLEGTHGAFRQELASSLKGSTKPSHLRFRPKFSFKNNARPLVLFKAMRKDDTGSWVDESGASVDESCHLTLGPPEDHPTQALRSQGIWCRIKIVNRCPRSDDFTSSATYRIKRPGQPHELPRKTSLEVVETEDERLNGKKRDWKKKHGEKANEKPFVPVFCGVSPWTMQPVFISGCHPASKGLNWVDLGQNFRGTAFNAEPSKRSTIPIPTIDSLRPDQLACYKKLSAQWDDVLDSDLKFPEGQLSVQLLKDFLYHQELSFSQGFPMPTLIFKSGTDEDQAPNMTTLIQTFPATTEFFKLEWPELTNENVPVQMVHLVREALEKFPRDIIPLNIAIATCFIWSRIKEHPTRYLEPKANGPVPLVSLMAAIVYMPEYLRRHERDRLSAYMHFFRFISHEQEHFSKIHGELHQIDPTYIREDEVSILARHQFANPRRWFWLAPFSMPGTQIPAPCGTGDIDVEGSTPSLHEATLIDDIHTLGQPYQVRGSEAESEFWFPKEILQATHVEKREVEGVYKLRVRDSILNSISGVSICNPATSIGMPRKALKGTEMVPDLAWTRIGLDVQMQPPSLKRDWDEFVTPSIQRQLREEGKSRLLKMRELNLDWSAIQVNSVGHLTWDALPRDFHKPRYALSDHPAPASQTPGRIQVPHKAKQAPAKMSEEQKEMIRKFISTHLVPGRPHNRCLDQLRQFTNGVHTETDMKKVLRGIWVNIEEQLITLDQFRDQLMKRQVIDPDRVHQTFDSRVLKPLETLFGIPIAASVQERMRAIGRVEPDLIAPLDQINGVLKADFLGSSAYEPIAVRLKAVFDLPGFHFIADYVSLATHLSGNLFSGAGWDLRANMHFLESGTLPGQSS